MSDLENLVFVGIDPHKAQHTVVMITPWNKELLRLQIAATPAGFDDLLQSVHAAAPQGKNVVFGIEDTGGLGRALSQWLVSQGQLVKGVNPVFSSDRRRMRPHPDKSDYTDAHAVARVLIEEFDRLPTVVNDAHYQALKDGSRRRDQLVQARTRCKNQLHGLLHAQYPEYKTFFGDPFGKTALAFWHKYPHPSFLQGVGASRLAAFLRKQSRNISVDRAQRILKHCDKRTQLTADAKMRATVVRQLVDDIRTLNRQIQEIEEILAEEVKRDDTHLTTLTGVAEVTAAKILGRTGGRFTSADKLARHAGIAPEENDTGSRGRRRKSKSGDRQLNAAFHRIALNQITVNRDGQPRCPEAYAYYQRKIAEGKSKLSALTCLKRRLVDIVFAMLRDKSTYRTPRQTPSSESSGQRVA